MNAKQAIQANNDLVVMLLDSSKSMAKRLNITIIEAIDKKVNVYEKNAKNSNEATAWFLRGEEAKKMI
jgi:hypothetical protein